ncbi:MAG TPA: DUF1549 domain-containing protein [Planctomycetota bacterium]
MNSILAVVLALSQDVEFFEAKVRPILVDHCLKCHGEKKPKGGLRLDSKAGWEKGGDSGPALVPGKPDRSLLLKMIRPGSESPPEMPPDSRLPAEAVDILQKWIQMGAPDPRTGTASTARAIDWTAAGEFWAFQPVKAAPGTIDHFVDAKLREKGLAPVGKADRWTLIRRATYGLTGLPPTKEDVDAFLADGDFAKVVDRLLASPAYGEHQARSWLDLARYAEDQAHVSEGKLGYGWRYRDWVIEAFNKDLPYARFVKLQIAADLIDENPAEKRALGFIGLGNVYARPNDLARARAEQWDDRVDTLTRAFLGLTVSCARCHDHKFDPIPTVDYYSLTGIIASSRDTVVWTAPAAEVAVYEAAVAERAKADAFLAVEIDRLAGEKAQTFDEDPKAVDFLRKRKQTAEAVLTTLAKPVKERDQDLLKALFGEKGLYPLTEKQVVEQASEAWKAEYAKRKAVPVPPEPARAHGVVEGEKPADLKVFIRGNPHKQGEPAPRRFLRALAGPDAAQIARGSGRAHLAEAVAATPLAARVMVNRIWQQHFGRGIVSTPSNFGALGARPTHPELLDALAARFTTVKALHREILLSAAYQRASTIDPRNEAVDPENQWLWRVPRRRLTAEALRDSLLAVTGALDRARGGPSGDVDDLKFPRRTIYGKVSRMELSPLLRLFDFPDPNLSGERRTETTLPQQSLFLLNNPFMIERAKALAFSSVDEAYARVFARAPSDVERRLGEAWKGPPAVYAQALLASNSFLFVD